MTPEALTLQGLCPACGHQLDDFIQFDRAYAKRFGEGQAECVSATPQRHKELQTVLACNCASEHKGRPEKTLGCGAYSGVKIELARGQRRWLPWRWKGPEKRQVRLSTLSARSTEKRWDDAAGEAEEGMLARTQDVGTKWAATVATVLALSGVAILLEARDEIAELKDPSWANAGAVAALVLGLIATLSAACAAQGLPGRVLFVTGAELRRRTRRSVKLGHWGIRVAVELYPEVVDGDEEEGGVPSRLIKTDRRKAGKEGTPWQMFAGSRSGRATKGLGSRSMTSRGRALVR